VGHEDADRAADEAQQHALREHLAHQSTTSGAERHTDGEVMPAASHSGQLYAGQVDASDEQDEDPQPHAQPGDPVAGEVEGARLLGGHQAGAASGLEVGIEASRDQVYARLSPGHRDPGLEPAEQP
jgi:hypothetical protein